jgi:hypothetical protein
MSTIDINALHGARPVTIDPAHRVVLIRINRPFQRGMADAELYEATRQWWKVAEQRRQLGTPPAPNWAMAVFGGVVRAVYRIEAWEPAGEAAIAGNPRRAGRWGFRGSRDQDMESIYLHRDVSGHLRGSTSGQAAQNPLRYVNC